MKYKIYEKLETISHYTLKKSKFKEKYIVKIHYVDVNYLKKSTFDNLKETKEYEQYILDLMNKQICDFLNNQEEFEKRKPKEVIKVIEPIRFMMNQISIFIPLLFTSIYKDYRNLLLYFPIQIGSIFCRSKIIDGIKEEIEDDILKYYLFFNNIDFLREYSQYITKDKKIVNANNIDKYTLDSLQQLLDEMRELRSNEEELKVKTKSL